MEIHIWNKNYLSILTWDLNLSCHFALWWSMMDWGRFLDMIGSSGGQVWGVDNISKLIPCCSVCRFGQGGECDLVVIWGGLCLFCQPVLLSQGGGKVWGVQMAGLWFWWGCWFSRRCTEAVESKSTRISTGNWSRGGICESRRGSGTWPRVNSQGLSRSAGAAVDSMSSVPGGCGVGGASCSMWGGFREGVWHLLSSVSLQYDW